MAGQTTLEFGQLLLLAMGPAAITAFVAIAAPLLLEWRKQEAERKKRRGEKLEELVRAVHDLQIWLEATNQKNVFDSKVEVIADPVGRIEALVSIYFPQFHNLSDALKSALGAHVVWTLEAGKRRIENHPRFADGIGDTFRAFLQAKKELQEALSSYGHHEFG